MKKQLLCLGICALGLILGSSNTIASFYNEKMRDSPSKINIKNVFFHRYETVKPVCLYSPEGRNIGSNENPKEGTIALEFDINVYDANIIKYVFLGWGGYEGENKDIPIPSSELKSRETTISRLDNGYSEKYLKEIPFKIKIEDWKGNISERRFTLDQILKDAESMRTKPMKLIDGKHECDENL